MSWRTRDERRCQRYQPQVSPALPLTNACEPFADDVIGLPVCPCQGRLVGLALHIPGLCLRLSAGSPCSGRRAAPPCAAPAFMQSLIKQSSWLESNGGTTQAAARDSHLCVVNRKYGIARLFGDEHNLLAVNLLGQLNVQRHCRCDAIKRQRDEASRLMVS